MEDLWLVVGLGNPGSRYEHTWHNIGFSVIDELARRVPGTTFQDKFHAKTALCTIAGQRVHLLKPQTFMNLSGQSVGEAARFYKIDLATKLLVITDDLDLDVGRLRLRMFGGTGGHNGLKSIHGILGTEKYPRLRVGVGRSDKLDPASHVLSKATGEAKIWYEHSARDAADAVERCLKDGVALAMNAVNIKKEKEDA